MSLNIKDSDITIEKSGEYEIIGSSNIHNIYINANSTIILNNVDIDVSKESKAAIMIQEFKDVIIILVGKNKIKSGDNYAGVQMNGECKVLIKGDEEWSSLNIESGTSGAGIGGGFREDLAGELTIESCVLNILSTREGAGIGGGNGRTGGGNLSGKLTIEGGNINIITGNYGGAGIGGGCNGDLSGDVIINNGKISSLSGDFGIGSAIGGGYDANLSGELVINGGEVTAIGGEGASGIGGAMNLTEGGCLSGKVILNGGSILAKGGLYLGLYGGAGIGGGFDGNLSGEVNLNDGVIVAQKAGNANDIGAGSKGKTTGKITVNIENIQINPSLLNMNIGESNKLNVIVTIKPEVYANIAIYGKTKYFSEDTTVAIVNQNGLVTAVGKGKTKVIVTSMFDESKSATCSVTVSDEIIKIGDIDLLIEVDKEDLNEKDLQNIICYGNNPIIKEIYLYDNIKKTSLYATIQECDEIINVSAEYKQIKICLYITYSIVLFTSKEGMQDFKVYAFQEGSISSHLEFCLSKYEEFDINDFKVVLNPKYNVDKKYSNKYYLFKISGEIGLIKM